MDPFRVTASQRLYDGRVISLRVDTLAVGEGKTVRREIVEHPGAVVIAALDNQRRLLMVRQYRHAARRTLLELPAGTCERGEDPAVTAARELQEETGYFPEDLTPAGGFYSAPGFCEEYLHLFTATRLRPARLAGDDDEDIQVETLPLARVQELVRAGEIRDSKTLAGLMVLGLLLGGGV